jgi:hypothetical protein
MFSAGCVPAACLAESGSSAGFQSREETCSRIRRRLRFRTCTVRSRDETARTIDARPETEKFRRALRETERFRAAEILGRAGLSRRAGVGILRLRQSAFCAGSEMAADRAKRFAAARLRSLLEFAGRAGAQSRCGSAGPTAGISQGLSRLRHRRSSAAVFRCCRARTQSARGNSGGSGFLPASRAEARAAFPARRSAGTIRATRAGGRRFICIIP